jgi:hypothetical protein
VDTSHDAAAAAAYQQRWKVLATYAAGVASDYTGATYYVAGPAQTDHAAYAAAGLDMVATAGRQRCSDLRHLGYIVRTGEKGTTPAGRSAHLCAITEAGLDALAALR